MNAFSKEVDTATCENWDSLQSKAGNEISVINLQNTSGRKFSLYWKSFLGDNVIFADEFTNAKVKFMAGSYFMIMDDTTSTCLSVIRSLKKDQKIILK